MQTNSCAKVNLLVVQILRICRLYFLHRLSCSSMVFLTSISWISHGLPMYMEQTSSFPFDLIEWKRNKMRIHIRKQLIFLTDKTPQKQLIRFIVKLIVVIISTALRHFLCVRISPHLIAKLAPWWVSTAIRKQLFLTSQRSEKRLSANARRFHWKLGGNMFTRGPSAIR